MRGSRLWIGVLGIAVAAAPVAVLSAEAVPVAPGVRLVRAIQEPRGDYESLITVAAVSGEEIAFDYSGGEEGNRVNTQRAVAAADLRQAREWRAMYGNRDSQSYPGSTSVVVSTAILDDLRRGKQAAFTIHLDDDPFSALLGGLSGVLPPGAAGEVAQGDGLKDLAGLSDLIGGILGSGEKEGGKVGANAGGKGRRPTGALQGVLQRVDSKPFRVLLNDRPVDLPAIRARGKLGAEDAEFVILDQPSAPIVLAFALAGFDLRTVKIAVPSERPSDDLERRLIADRRAELHGIYFDFAQDTLRPESEAVLAEIADVLSQNPEWKLSIEGHTDAIGGAESNLDLSRRRALAVRRALSERHGIASERLQTAGHGAARPQDTNDTLAGRARNRRVELVRL